MPPATIFILRHGEKPANKNETALSQRGEVRARFLAEFFTGEPIRGLFAARPPRFGKPTQGSTRSVDTLRLLATKFGVEINIEFEKKHHEPIARTILGEFVCGDLEKGIESGAFSQGTAIICWQHENIRDLAISLRGEDPGEWPKAVNLAYDTLYVIRYAKEHLTKDGQSIVVEKRTQSFSVS